MKRKLVAIIMALVMISGVTAACSSKKEVPEEGQQTGENVQNNVTKPTEGNTTPTSTPSTTPIPTTTPSGGEKDNVGKTITVDDAIKILQEKYGTKDEATGNTMSYGYMTTVKDSEGNSYYAFRHSWLVDNNHTSFLQNVFVSLDGKTIRTSSMPKGFEENEVVEFDEVTE